MAEIDMTSPADAGSAVERLMAAASPPAMASGAMSRSDRRIFTDTNPRLDKRTNAAHIGGGTAQGQTLAITQGGRPNRAYLGQVVM
jgi:hypothetical protein